MNFTFLQMCLDVVMYTATNDLGKNISSTSGAK